MGFDIEHFAFSLLVCQYGDKDSFEMIYASLDEEENQIVKRAWEVIIEMKKIYGTKVFDEYFEKKFKENDNLLHSKKAFVRFVLVRCFDFCEAPTFFNFLTMCYMITRVQQTLPKCYLILHLLAKCITLMHAKRYREFFDKFNGLVGLRQNFDRIYYNTLPHYVSCQAHSRFVNNIRIHNYDNVCDVVEGYDQFEDECFKLFECDLSYIYDIYISKIDPENIQDNLKMPESSSASPDIEEQISEIELMLDDLHMCSEGNFKKSSVSDKIKERCSFCGENCYKYVMSEVTYRIEKRKSESS
ncbi:hypothetical protein CEXT_815011 [Caerostris extrusa]|uniref:Uncharacterized protein n=1 Tax=Caerostris extrusa TaxID=172846 RepID=A0AAV4R3X2_CAEEX|nr:hypothetical protein CEXT_815011 [Caerostris extrusa]